MVEGIRAYGVKTLPDVVEILSGRQDVSPLTVDASRTLSINKPIRY